MHQTIEPKKKTFQSPIYQAEYSRKDNLLRHLKSFKVKILHQRCQARKSRNPNLVNGFKHSFYNDRLRSNDVWNNRMGKKTVSTKRKHDDPCTKKVLFCYKHWQPSYIKMLKIILDITFPQGTPNGVVQSKYFDPNAPSLIVFDDLIRTVMNDDMATDLFTEGAHHHNTSVVFIIQFF